MNRQLPLRFLLLVQTIALLAYSYIAFQNEGANLLQLFFSNITSLTWNGQFNLDFSCYLTLSGVWIMWRNKFAPAAIVLGLSAMIIGIMAFAPYVLYLLTKENGDLKKVLIGDR
ncbi:hypothetical protein [Spirosoma linguale]|uniref:DUF2834 domain-containing protein n=1 Tax=Spirosoma linguale (strain ATCC 33905 / DSM 74 / LMG 10896 / Claus 1) TaxID=504472 RepID=D2QSA4_SPILD|nr:hypothetical protein Slin_5721 [Spirosoma linguale DSM 74]